MDCWSLDFFLEVLFIIWIALLLWSPACSTESLITSRMIYLCLAWPSCLFDSMDQTWLLTDCSEFLCLFDHSSVSSCSRIGLELFGSLWLLLWSNKSKLSISSAFGSFLTEIDTNIVKWDFFSFYNCIHTVYYNFSDTFVC